MPAKKPKADGEEELDEDAVAAITDADDVADEDESDSEWTDKVDDPDEDF
jgi:hypothetical protein